jgi:hypothetical protein
MARELRSSSKSRRQKMACHHPARFYGFLDVVNTSFCAIFNAGVGVVT